MGSVMNAQAAVEHHYNIYYIDKDLNGTFEDLGHGFEIWRIFPK
jgi:hypothetical protein